MEEDVCQVCGDLYRQAQEVVLFVFITKSKLGDSSWDFVEPYAACAWEAIQPTGMYRRPWWTVRDFVHEVWERD